jgi:hypothetical protein
VQGIGNRADRNLQEVVAVDRPQREKNRTFWEKALVREKEERVKRPDPTEGFRTPFVRERPYDFQGSALDSSKCLSGIIMEYQYRAPW